MEILTKEQTYSKNLAGIIGSSYVIVGTIGNYNPELSVFIMLVIGAVLCFIGIDGFIEREIAKRNSKKVRVLAEKIVLFCKEPTEEGIEVLQSAAKFLNLEIGMGLDSDEKNWRVITCPKPEHIQKMWALIDLINKVKTTNTIPPNPSNQIFAVEKILKEASNRTFLE